MERFRAIQSWCERRSVLMLFGISLILLATIAVRGKHLQMTEWMHGRLGYYAFPCAVSMLCHHGAPYAIYSELPEIFSNDDLQKAAGLTLTNPENTRMYPAEDKGMVDIVLLAFLLFGFSIQAVFYATILLQTTTVLAFFLAFRDSPARCLAPVFILGGIFAAMPSILLTSEAGSLTNPRVFEFLGLIPLAHLLLAVIDRGGITWSRFLGLAFQVVIMMECIHVRCSASWMVGAVGLFFLVTVVMAACGRIENFGVKKALMNGWVLAVLAIGVLGWKGYQKAIYPPEYSQTMLQHRVVWHNVGIGCALHPRLAEKYDLCIGDECIINLIKKRLAERHDQERLETIWGKPNEQAYLHWPGAIAQDFQAYEEEAKAVVLEIARDNPRAMAELFLFYKPKLALRTLAWAANCYPRDQKRLWHQGQTLCVPSAEAIAKRHLYIRLGDLLAMALVLAGLCLCSRIPVGPLLTLMPVLLILLLGSLIPPVLSYPIIHVLGVSLLCVTCLAFLLLTTFFVYLGNLATQKMADRKVGV
jgi:hypothetical protein